MALRVGREADEEKDGGGLDDAGGEALLDVAAAKMTDFVSEHGDEFGRGAFFDERVEEGDFAIFSEAGEECVGLGRALRAIHDEDILHRKSAAVAE